MSPDILHSRTLLFELSKPVIMSIETFNETWPYVDSVYTKLRGEQLHGSGTVRVQKYECRLRKSKSSSTARDASSDKVIKRKHSSIRDHGLCQVRIKVSRPVDGSAVTIERIDECTHTHDIEESFRVKKRSILLDYIAIEAAKNYSTAQIFHALRGAGTLEGSEKLVALGGSSLTKYDLTSLLFS